MHFRRYLEAADEEYATHPKGAGIKMQRTRHADEFPNPENGGFRNAYGNRHAYLECISKQNDQ